MGGSWWGEVDHVWDGVGHARMSRVMQGWGGSCMGGVGHARVE